MLILLLLRRRKSEALAASRAARSAINQIEHCLAPRAAAAKNGLRVAWPRAAPRKLELRPSPETLRRLAKLRAGIKRNAQRSMAAAAGDRRLAHPAALMPCVHRRRNKRLWRHERIAYVNNRQMKSAPRRGRER